MPNLPIFSPHTVCTHDAQEHATHLRASCSDIRTLCYLQYICTYIDYNNTASNKHT